MTTTALKVLIADDEPPARERLQRLVAELGGWRVAGTCGTGFEALELVRELDPAVVLLDIRMPGISGIEVARHLSMLENPPAIVFTTAYDQYALEAFDSRAVGYLLKPVRRERLADALQHAARLTAPILRALGGERGAFAQRRHVAVRTRGELKLIPVEQIIAFRADQKYVTVCHDAGEDLIEESLRNLDEEFGGTFVRIHRSLLVAIARIDGLQRRADGSHWVRIRDSDERLPVSRRQWTELKARLHAGR
jgi:two-component system, LytTR family, response regulator AlgR